MPPYSIHYHTYVAGKNNNPVTGDAFRHLLKNCSLGQRRPTDDMICTNGMIDNSNLIISAWEENSEGKQLIGIARAMTDFHYACYLSDLAVHNDYQRKGVGKKLIENTTKAIQKKCKVILLAAPNANEYYAPLGFDNNPRGWVLNNE